MTLSDILGFVFPGLRKPATPADQKPHDERQDETVDMETGIGVADGQELDNTEIDPTIQDERRGFPK